MEIKTVEEINQYIGSTVNPSDNPDTVYELYSVPSFESQHPEIIKGENIGSSKITVEEGDVLVCKINPRINRVWIVKRHTSYPLLASSEWIVIRNRDIDSNYLKWYFSSPTFRNLLVSQVAGIGGSLTRAQPKQVAKYPVPVVGKEEQRRIAALLDKVSDLIAKRRAQLDKLDLLEKARFVEMFENGPKSEKILLGDISEFVTVGIANSATHAYAKSGVVMLRNQNIKENHLDDNDLVFIKKEFADKYNTKSLKENDILVTRTGYPGVACLVPAQYEGAQTFTTLIVRLKKSVEIHPNFICHYINSSYGKAYVEGKKVGVAQQNFGAKVLALMPIVIPEVKLQNDFTDFCIQIDKLKTSVKDGLDKLGILKKALMEQYFG